MTLIVPSGSFASKAIGILRIGWGLLVGPYGKFILYGAIIIGGLWYFRLWLNKHDDRIFRQGRDQAVQTMQRDFEAQWKVKLAEAKAQSATAQADRKAVEARLDELNSTFGALFASLGQIRKAVDERQVIYVEKAGAVPASQLDDTLRAVSNSISKSPD